MSRRLSGEMHHYPALVASWVPGCPARRQTSALLWTSDDRRPSAQPPCPSPTVPIVVQWPSWDGLLVHYSLWRLYTVQLLKCIMCILWTFSTSPQKPPTTYTRVNNFRPHRDSLFRGTTYTRERLIREYIRYSIRFELLNNSSTVRFSSIRN